MSTISEKINILNTIPSIILQIKLSLRFNHLKIETSSSSFKIDSINLQKILKQVL